MTAPAAERTRDEVTERVLKNAPGPKPRKKPEEAKPPEETKPARKPRASKPKPGKGEAKPNPERKSAKGRTSATYPDEVRAAARRANEIRGRDGFRVGPMQVARTLVALRAEA